MTEEQAFVVFIACAALALVYALRPRRDGK